MPEGFSTNACSETSSSDSHRIISDQLVAALGVIRAEKLFLQGWQPERLMVEVDQEED